MSQLDEIIERVPTLVERLREPIDWAHFVSDDHAEDYAAERREAADRIAAAETERDNLLAWFDGLTPSEMHAAIVRDKDRIKALEAALKPIAEACDDADRLVGHDDPMGQYIDYDTLCAARNALSQVMK